MWTDLRKNIETIIRENNTPEDQFKPLDINSWKNIEDKINSTFCNITNHRERLIWLWEDFKQDCHSIQFEHNYPFDQLVNMVDNSEYVWLFINESVNEGTKFWFYEGLIKTIVFVLRESFADEVYIASKKYEWLLCLNHHDTLIATGKYMPDKIRKMETIFNLKK